ncbi:hypothetical protein [Pedobacter sp. SYSU D00535]|uniref:hypothetical protein n=1 Tax=Pedobacter sp. SYSU D00535 TaxID=2810308 RepID=UPI001A9683BA|nr:hypothetical protein [Pedobacter sp. SYSU D00535]
MEAPEKNQLQFTEKEAVTNKETLNQTEAELPTGHDETKGHVSHHRSFVPHHSNHGRSNYRSFGANHEPGTGW